MRRQLLDSIVIALLQIITFGYFFPLGGMPSSLILPLFIGAFTNAFVSVGYGSSLSVVYDLGTTRLIDFQRTLPISTWLVVVTYILNLLVELILVSLVPFILGLILLPGMFQQASFSWGIFIFVYLLGALFFATLFIAIAYARSFTWYLNNVWARILGPLQFLGCSFYPLGQLLHSVGPWSYLCFVSPLTYLNEGLRISSGASSPLSWWLCSLVLLIGCCINGSVLYYSFRRVHDFI